MIQHPRQESQSIMENRVPARPGLGLFVRRSGAMLCLVSVPAMGMDAEIVGIEGEMADNVEVYLQGLDGSQYRVERLRNEVVRLTQEAMRVYGYYEPQIEMRFDRDEEPEEVFLTIDKGQPVKLEVIDFTLEGDAREDAPFQLAIDAYPQ